MVRRYPDDLASADIGVYTRFMDSPCYCDVLRTSARKITAVYDRHLSAADLTLAQFRLLKKVNGAGKLSISGLAVQTGLDRSTIGRNVHVLQRHGLVTVTDDDDLRRSMIALTADGQARLRLATPLWQAAQADIETRLGPDRLSAITGLVDAF